MTLDEAVRLAVAVLLLIVMLVVVLRLGGVRSGWAPVTAIARGALQLTVVGLALGGVFAAPLSAAAVLLVMLGTASWTATRRLRGLGHAGRAVVLSCASGAAAALSVVFAVGVLPLSARFVVAAGGIVVGGTMTGATLAGRNLLRGIRARRDEVEAWLALGASPLEAARFQLVVLAAVLAAQAVVAVLVTLLLGAPSPLPAAEGGTVSGPDPAARDDAVLVRPPVQRLAASAAHGFTAAAEVTAKKSRWSGWR